MEPWIQMPVFSKQRRFDSASPGAKVPSMSRAMIGASANRRIAVSFYYVHADIRQDKRWSRYGIPMGDITVVERGGFLVSQKRYKSVGAGTHLL
jgi:hypothetical protein